MHLLGNSIICGASILKLRHAHGIGKLARGGPIQNCAIAAGEGRRLLCLA
jgi:hypothetical protein